MPSPGSSQPDEKSRQECLRLLVSALYRELASSLSAAIESAEGRRPASNRVGDLIAGRDWLFEGMSSYTDSTHLASILRFTPELDDAETIRMALEMADYGQRLWKCSTSAAIRRSKTSIAIMRYT